MGTKAYLASASVAFLALCACCISLTVFVDPYRMFDTAAVAGLTALKPRIYEHAELAKAYQLERVRPRTILLGNSRTECGFDPESSVWPETWRPVFNAGLAGRRLFTARRMFQHAIAAGQVKTAVLQVDFPDFLTSPDRSWFPSSAEPAERRLLVSRSGRPNSERGIQMWRDKLKTTLTIDSLVDSIFTLLNQHAGSTETMTRFGFNPLRQYAADVKRIGYGGLFAQKQSAYEAAFRRYPRRYFINPERYAEFRDLSEIIRIAREYDVRLIIFIPPYHAQLLKIIEHDGLWPNFEAWKRALVDVVGRQCAIADGSPCAVQLIDFSGYNNYSTEPVPANGDKRSQTTWYWEAGHYKAALGDVILKEMISSRYFFGKALTSMRVTPRDIWSLHLSTQSKAPQ